ncbi:MAG: hypothetical protein LBM04_13755 [Opitutaceae bacterium]|jgi:hypothetical protein|nr:hypothetical protein [Opitutaceae bacterium]
MTLDGFMRVIGDDLRIDHLQKLISGPGYVLPVEIRQILRQSATTWTLVTANVDCKNALSEINAGRDPYPTPTHTGASQQRDKACRHAANSGVERASRPLTAKPPDRVARASCPWTARSAAPYAGPDAGETPALLPKRGQDARATSGTRARCPRLGVLLVPFLRCALLRVSAVPDLASGRGLLCASLPAHGLIQSQALQNPAAAQHQSPI